MGLGAGATHSSASAALSGAIRRDKDQSVRATAVWAAGSIGDPAAIEALTSALGDSDPEVRERAAWAIGSCGPDAAPAALLKALSDQNPDVRLSAAWALYTIRDTDAVTALDAAFRHENQRRGAARHYPRARRNGRSFGGCTTEAGQLSRPGNP